MHDMQADGASALTWPNHFSVSDDYLSKSARGPASSPAGHFILPSGSRRGHPFGALGCWTPGEPEGMK